MNTKVIGALLIGVVIGVIIGLVVASRDVLNKKRFIAQDIQAYITIDTLNNNVCTQRTGSLDGPVTPFPVLRASAGDTITWHGNTNAQPVLIQFPQGSQDDPGTPFKFAGSGQRRTDFSQNQDSGPPRVTVWKDFPFYGVTVGGQVCSNPQGAGVHVDK